MIWCGRGNQEPLSPALTVHTPSSQHTISWFLVWLMHRARACACAAVPPPWYRTDTCGAVFRCRSREAGVRHS